MRNLMKFCHLSGGDRDLPAKTESSSSFVRCNHVCPETCVFEIKLLIDQWMGVYEN